jgi:hypothetical protein
VVANGRKWALLHSREGWEGEEIENLEPLARSHWNSGKNKFFFGANDCKPLQTTANSQNRFPPRTDTKPVHTGGVIFGFGSVAGVGITVISDFEFHISN